MAKVNDEFTANQRVSTKPGAWRTLSILILALNMLLATAMSGGPPGMIEALMGALTVLLLGPILIVALFSLSQRFRNSRSRYKIFFWSSVTFFVGLTNSIIMPALFRSVQ